MIVGSELAKEFQEIKSAWGTEPDEDKDKDKKGKGRGSKKGDSRIEVAAEEDTATTDAP